jgi:short-subunit dehydrogenase
MASLTSLADWWIGRSAARDPAALAAVTGRTPAVVVTGASRGIGRALAFRFARAGHNVAMIARGADALQEAAHAVARATNARAVPLTLDITHANATRDLDASLAAAGLYADVLVNNAGVGLAGLFSEQSEDDIAHLITLNVTAATQLMHHVLPGMLARGRGGVINVASLGGLVPGPYQAAYYASKAYLISLSEAVAHEARGRGVRIVAVAPGPVETTFHHAMHAESALYRTIVPAQTADQVARSAYRGYALGRRVVVPGVLPTLAALGVKLLPHALTVPLVSALLAVEPGRRRG